MGKVLGQRCIHFTERTLLDYGQLRRSEETYFSICLDAKARTYSQLTGFGEKSPVRRDRTCVVRQVDDNLSADTTPATRLGGCCKTFKTT